MKFMLKVASFMLYLQAALFTLLAVAFAWQAIEAGQWPFNMWTVFLGGGAIGSVSVARWKSTTTRRKDAEQKLRLKRRKIHKL